MLAGMLAFSLLLLEVLLQASSLVFRAFAPRGRVEVSGAESREEYRILCLGESTTHGFGVRSYPHILGSRLASRDFGVRFQVVNAGRLGQNSRFLADWLPSQVARHRPDMVIVMMGVNDEIFFPQTTLIGLPVDFQLALLKLRTYKLARLVSSSLRGMARRDVPPSFAAAAEMDDEVAEFNRRSMLYADPEYRRTHDDVDQELLALIRQARDASRPAAGRETEIEIAAPYRFHYHLSYNTLRTLYLERGEAETAEALFLEALEKHPRSQFFHRGLAGLYEEIGQHGLATQYLTRAGELAAKRVRTVTQVSYQRVESFLRDQGIVLVAMQYPLRSIATLRYLLDNSSYPIYVDNEGVFRDAVARHGYDAIFFDRFGGDMGHCTVAGNRIIVDNLMATVFEPMFSAEPTDPTTKRPE